MKKSSDKIIAGVCAGIAEKYELDPEVVRLIFLLAALMGFGLPIIIYIILAIIL